MSIFSIFYAENRSKIKKRNDIIKATRTLNNKNTNHILHFLLSLFTSGLWVIVWVFVTLSNANERRKALNILAASDMEINI